jgi:hypothetical protein|tara:strand:- start:2627 stop:3064 length:438 start_codon:yes stop_codon:yes gene_type:complete
VDPRELVNHYLDISENLLSKLVLNKSIKSQSDQYLFILSIEQSLDYLADSIAESVNFKSSKFISYEYQTKWLELSSNQAIKNIINNELVPSGLFHQLKQTKKNLHEPVNDLIIVSNETLSLKKFNLLLDKYKEFIILLRKTLDEC